MKLIARNVTVSALARIAESTPCRITPGGPWNGARRDFALHTRRDGRTEVNFTLRTLYASAPCARLMGCLCAGHARGNPDTAPCDTRETGKVRRRQPSPVPYRRLSTYHLSDFKLRTVGGPLCWHGHRDFMRAMFVEYPDAVLKSAFITYQGRDDFERRHWETGERNVGSTYSQVLMSEVCYCNREGYDERGLPVVREEAA